MLRRSPFRILVMAVVAVVLLVLVVDRLVVTEGERLEALPGELSSALASEDPDRLVALITGDFSFRGPPPVRSGDYEETFVRLADFWRQVTSAEVTWRQPSVARSGQIATVEISGLVRFRYGDMLVVYRVDSRLVCVRGQERWRLRRLDIVDLRRGIL